MTPPLPAPPNARLNTTSHPQHAEQAHGEEVLHEHAEHVLGPDHASVEEREPGVMNSTSAVAMSIHAVSPPFMASLLWRRRAAVSVEPTIGRPCRTGR